MITVCPKCRPTKMETVMGKTCVHELCPTCHGVFFDMRETEDEALAGISDEHRAEETKFCKTGSQQRASWDARPCPRCDETMMKEFEYSHESGIHIDLCPSCGGMFLDGGELEEIRRYLATAHLPKTETKMPEVTSAHKLDIELKGRSFSDTGSAMDYAKTADEDSMPAVIRLGLNKKLLDNFSSEWGIEFTDNVMREICDGEIEYAL